VIGPVFDEVVAEDDGPSRQGRLQLRFNSDKRTCEFGKSTSAKAASTTQIVFEDRHYKFDEITKELVRDTTEQFVLDLIAGKFFR
jgi:hypothetical protein